MTATDMIIHFGIESRVPEQPVPRDNSRGPFTRVQYVALERWEPSTIPLAAPHLG